MGEAIAKVIGVTTREDLRFCLEPAKSARMNYAIPIALKVIAVRMRWLRIAAPARVLHRVACEHVLSVAKTALSSQYSTSLPAMPMLVASSVAR